MSDSTRIKEQIRGLRGRARGTKEKSANPKISVRFDQSTFDKINDFAEDSRCTFGEGVRLLIEYAFAKLESEEADE